MVNPTFDVTVYKLDLGDYDSTTGVPARTYTSVSARVAVVPKGTSLRVFGFGYYGANDAEGITAYEVNEGDIIVNVYGSTSVHGYWQVMTKQAVVIGNVLEGYFLGLRKLLFLPFIEPGEGTPTTDYVGYDPEAYDSTYYEYSLLITIP